MINFTTEWDRAGIKHVTPRALDLQSDANLYSKTLPTALFCDMMMEKWSLIQLNFIYLLIFLTLIELLHETPVFPCINHKQITLLQKCINHYHQCKKCRIKFFVAPNPNIVVGT